MRSLHAAIKVQRPARVLCAFFITEQFTVKAHHTLIGRKKEVHLFQFTIDTHTVIQTQQRIIGESPEGVVSIIIVKY